MSPTDPNAAPVIAVRGLHKSFGDNEVLKGIDFEVRRGEVVALIGPSGSGKTTVLRSLNSLSVPDGGTVTFASGLEIDFSTKVSKRDLLALRDCSAMVFQHNNLFPHKTVLENVIEGPVQVQKVPVAVAKADAERLLDRVGLLEKRDDYPFELSGGQQQRVGIARALSQEPSIMLADEPVASLDPPTSHAVMQDLRRISREDGITTLVNLHFIDMAREYADRIVGMNAGEVVFDGTPEEATDEVFERIYGRAIDAEKDLRGAA